MALQVQALRPEHIPYILAACSDWKELSQYGPPYWRPRSTAELQRKIDDTAGPTPAQAFTFVLADENRLVGECSIHAIDWRNRHAQIGVCIWSPSDRRRGYGRAGVSFVSDWGMQHLNLLKLEAWILSSNQASKRLFEEFGYRLEGTLRARYCHDGANHDIDIFGLVSPKLASK